MMHLLLGLIPALALVLGHISALGGGHSLVVLLIVGVVIFVLLQPRWGYSRGWGYNPTFGFGGLLVLLIILYLLGII